MQPVLAQGQSASQDRAAPSALRGRHGDQHTQHMFVMSGETDPGGQAAALQTARSTAAVQAAPDSSEARRGPHAPVAFRPAYASSVGPSR